MKLCLHSPRLAFLVAITMCTVLSGTVLYAQRLDGSLRGTVTDATGAVLPGATVILTSDARGTTQQTTTNSVGIYQFPNLIVGKYTVSIEVPGFSRTTLKDVDVLSNQTVDANVTLEVGAITTEVSVTTSGELVALSTSQVGGSVPERAVIDIPNPVLGGSPLNLAVLFPNTTTQGGGVLGEGGSIGGNRPRNNNFTIDGVDNNDVALTGPLAPVIQDAVAEFNLLTNQFSAEYGHSTAGQFNIITKSGTNSIHGSAFFYGQNRKLNALHNLQKGAIERGDIPGKARYDFARAGGTAGGPIIQDKLFYFGAYEYQTQGLSATGVTVKAPTQAGLTTLNSLAANSAVRAILAQMPTALAASETQIVNGQTIPVGNLQAFSPDFFNQHDFQTNIDASLTNHQIRGRFLFDRYRAPNPNPDLPLPQFTGSIQEDNRKIIITDAWTMNPRTVMDLRGSYSRNVQSFSVPDQFNNFPNVAIDVLGLSFGPEGNSPQTGIQNTYQGVVNISHVLGAHQLKEGFEYRNWISPQQFLPRSRGEWDYANLSQLVNDQVPRGLNGALRGAGLSVFAGNQQAFYWFVQDDWKTTPNLTLNLGLRYEWTSNARDTKLQALNAISSLPGVFDFREPKTDKNNFGPRFGFAWSPNFGSDMLRTMFGESGRTSIRGGFAAAYDVTFQNLPLLQLPPQLQTEQNPQLSCASPTRPSWCATQTGFLAGGGLLQVNVPPTTQADARSATQGLIMDQTQPKTLTWTLSLQREVATNWQVEARYLGTRGLNLPIQVRLNSISVFESNPNLVLPTYFSRSQVPSTVPLTAPTRAQVAAAQDLRFSERGFDGGFVSAYPPVGTSIYHAGSVELNRHVTSGLWLKTGYTFSKAIDTATNELFSSRVNPRRPQDPYNFADERGLSTLHKPHKFTVAWVYDLPQAVNENGFVETLLNGWQFNGAYIAETGQPVTIQSGVDANGDFDSAADRAILNPNGTGLTGSGVDFVLRNAVGVTSISSSPPAGAQVVGYVAKNASARFIVAELGARSTVGRNTVESPGINNWDLSFFKNNRLTESTSVQLRFEMFNAFNHRQRTLGARTVEQFNDNALSTSYANASSLDFLNDGQFNGGSRQIQLSLKLIF